MDNYKQKLFLLCTLLLGCVLTSVGIEYFAIAEEPVKIEVPKFVEEQKQIQTREQEKKVNTVVNINTATIEELDALPGIGPALAKRIVEFRKEQPFTKPEDIMLVKGIGKKKFARMKELITVE